MTKILLVEDNLHILKINSEMLRLRGYEVYQAETAARCREVLSWHPVDIGVLDIMLPDGSGLELCREIKEKYHIPVILLTALGENRDVVEGLGAGADDYLSKPYDLEVLAARIQAQLRRQRDLSRYLSFGPLTLDTFLGRGSLHGEDLGLTRKEYLTLLLLLHGPGEVVAGETLCREIWNSSMEVSGSSLWTLLSRLRKKLQPGGLDIAVRRGDGYLLEHV